MLPTKMKANLFENLSKTSLRYLAPTPTAKATGLAAEVYAQIVEEFFVSGAVMAHDLRPTLLAGAWAGGREIVFVDGYFTREQKEEIGVSLAQLNGCTYCEDLLTAVVYAADREAADTLRRRSQDGPLFDWAAHTLQPGSRVIREPPFSPEEAPELVGTALVFHYLNRFVPTLFDGTPVNAPLGSEAIKSTMLRMFGFELKETTTKRLVPGRASGLLPAAELPADLAWAADNEVVAEAIARWAGAVETAGAEIPSAARTVIADAVSVWEGKPMPISRSWLEPFLENLDAPNRAVAKIGLLAALSPHQRTDADIEDVRAHFDDGLLTSTIAWSAFTAARRIASWLV